MATIIGSKYRTKNSTGGTDLHYLLTHAKAVLTDTYTPGAGVTTDKQFVTSSQLDFISALSDGTAEVPSITELETRIVSIENLINADDASNTTIDRLNEIIAFLNNATIAEGTTLTSFVEGVSRKITLNGTTIASGGTASFYAPTTSGNASNVLVSDGVGKSPYFTDVLWIRELHVDGTIGSSGSYSTTFGDIITAQGNIRAVHGNVEVETIDKFKVGASSTSIGNYLKSHVVKTTEPTAADYGRDAIPEGSVWLDTGTSVVDTTPASYRLNFNVYQGAESLVEAKNWAANWAVDTVIAHADSGKSRLILLDISASDGHYRFEYYTYVFVFQEMYISTWRWELIHYKSDGTNEVLFHIEADDSGSPTPGMKTEFTNLRFNTTPLSTFIPQGKVIINNLHLAPRFFYLSTEWD